MATRRVTVGSRVGLHARPATTIAEAASHYSDEILIELVEPYDPDNEPADAASSLMLMALGAEYGNEVEVTSTNADAVEHISGLISQELDI
nr:HPr family phosphocarrier protein [Corynebacterium lactis]